MLTSVAKSMLATRHVALKAASVSRHVAAGALGVHRAVSYRAPLCAAAAGTNVRRFGSSSNLNKQSSADSGGPNGKPAAPPSTVSLTGIKTDDDAEEVVNSSVALWFNNIYPVAYRKYDVRWMFIGKVASGSRLRTMTTSPLLAPPGQLERQLRARNSLLIEAYNEALREERDNSQVDEVGSSATGAKDGKNINSKKDSVVEYADHHLPKELADAIKVKRVKYIPNWKEGGLFAVIDFSYPKRAAAGHASINKELTAFIAQEVRASLKARKVRSFFNLQLVYCYPVHGQPWVDDMIGRTPSSKIKIEYELTKYAPSEARQAPIKLDSRTVYEHFRKFGRIIDVQHSPPLPPAIANSKDAPLPYVTIEYVRVRSATTARNCMPGDSGISIPIPASTKDTSASMESKKAPPSVASLEDAFSLTNTGESGINSHSSDKTATRDNNHSLSDSTYYKMIRRYAVDSDYFTPSKSQTKDTDSEKTYAPLSFRISYEKSDTKFNLWEWIMNHQRLSVPLIVAMIAGITYSVFDPYRVFSMTNRITGRFDLTGYYESLLNLNNHGGMHGFGNFGGYTGGGAGNWIKNIWFMLISTLGFGPESKSDTKQDGEHRGIRKPSPTSDSQFDENIRKKLNEISEGKDDRKDDSSGGVLGTVGSAFGWVAEKTGLSTKEEKSEVSSTTTTPSLEKEPSLDDQETSESVSVRQSIIEGWEDREIEAKKLISRLNQEPDSVILVNGPRGSGKSQLIKHVLKEFDFRLLVNLDQIAAATTDSQMLNRFAAQVNYFPLFSSFVQLSSLIDAAITATTGAKAGISTSNDAQVRRILELLTYSLEVIVRREQTRVKNLNDRYKRELEQHQMATDDRMADSYLLGEPASTTSIRDEDLLDRNIPDSEKVSLLDSGSKTGGSQSDTQQKTGSRQVVEQASTFDSGLVLPDAHVRYPVIVINGLMSKHLANTGGGMFGFGRGAVTGNGSSGQGVATGRADTSLLQEYLTEWATLVTELKIAHVVFVSDNPAAVKAVSRTANRAVELVSLHDASKELAERLLINKLSPVLKKNVNGDDGKGKGKSSSSAADGAAHLEGLSLAEVRRCVEVLGGRLTDLDLLVSQVSSSPDLPVLKSLNEIVSRATAEVRKIGVTGETLDTSKTSGLAWSRTQFWRVVQLLSDSNNNSASYEKIRFDPIFNGDEKPILALERVGLITISYEEGSPSMVVPGRPIYVEAFNRLLHDDKLTAAMGIDTCKQLIKMEEAKATQYGDEMIKLHQLQWSDDTIVRRQAAERMRFLASLLKGSETKIEKFYADLAAYKKSVARD